MWDLLGACQAQVRAHFKWSLGMQGPNACKEIYLIFTLFPYFSCDWYFYTDSDFSCCWAPPKIPDNLLTIKSNPQTAQISSSLHILRIFPPPSPSLLRSHDHPPGSWHYTYSLVCFLPVVQQGQDCNWATCTPHPKALAPTYGGVTC